MLETKLPCLDHRILTQMIQSIVQSVDPCQIILFGSQANGSAKPGSDVDFLIVKAGPFGLKQSRRKEAAKVWRALAEFGIPTDVLLYSIDEIEQWRHSPNHVISQALAEGKILYERSQTSGTVATGSPKKPNIIAGNGQY